MNFPLERIDSMISALDLGFNGVLIKLCRVDLCPKCKNEVIQVPNRPNKTRMQSQEFLRRISNIIFDKWIQEAILMEFEKVPKTRWSIGSFLTLHH